jgi:hypothetical protein
MFGETVPSNPEDRPLDPKQFAILPMEAGRGLIFNCPAVAKRLREEHRLVSNGLGIDPKQAKNLNAKCAPYVLSPLASEYLARK